MSAPTTPLQRAARALLDAFGGDTPDWLRAEAAALNAALCAEQAEPIRIVINVTGGVIQGASINRAAAIDIVTLDFDADDDGDGAEMIDLPGEGSAEVGEVGAFAIEPAFVAGVFARLAERDEAQV